MDNFDGKTIMGTAFDGKMDSCQFFFRSFWTAVIFLDHFRQLSFFLDHFGQLSFFLRSFSFDGSKQPFDGPLMGHHFFQWCEQFFGGGAAD